MIPYEITEQVNKTINESVEYKTDYDYTVNWSTGLRLY